jgi:hypothetical protein
VRERQRPGESRRMNTRFLATLRTVAEALEAAGLAE